MSNNVEMVTITKESYIELLESHYEQSKETRKVRETLQAEYNFAEEKIEAAKITVRFQNENLDRCLSDIVQYIKEQK